MSMTKIQHIEVTSAAGQASIEFTSIPQTYTDLKIVLSGRSDYTSADDFWKIEFNTYVTLPTGRLLYGTGSGSGASTTKSDGWLAAMPDDDWTANTFASADVYIPNYTSSAAKSISSDSVSENNATASLQALNASLWNVTDAITSIRLSSGNSATLLQYSSATLYGITAGSDGTTIVS